MYNASIQDSYFVLELDEHLTTVNDVLRTSNFEKIGSTSYRLKIDGKEHIADVVHVNDSTKEVTLRIEGKKYTVSVKEPLDLFLDGIGIHLRTPKKVNNLVAPMPGLVLKVLVNPGDTVLKGDSLLVLEAMKMENVFKAAENGVIKSIEVSEKQVVEKGTELITFE